MYYTIYDYLPYLKLRSLDNRGVSEDLSQCFDSSIYHRLLLANWNAQVQFDVLICSGPQTVIHMCDFRDGEVGVPIAILLRGYIFNNFVTYNALSRSTRQIENLD